MYLNPRILLITACVLLIGLWTVGPSWAQQEIADYNFQYEQYRVLYPQFETTRNEYLQYQTLTAQLAAVGKTKDILWQRAQTLRTYFFALRYKLHSTNGVDLAERARLSANLDDQIGWLQNHLDDIEGLSNPALSQLFEMSDRFERKEAEFRVLGHEALATILIGKVRHLHQQTTTINSQLSTFVVQTSGGAYLKNWLDEAQSNALKAAQSLRRAEATLSELEDGASDATQTQRIFAIIQAEITTASRLLGKGSDFQQEIIRDLQKYLPKQEQPNQEGDDQTEQATASAESVTVSMPNLAEPSQSTASGGFLQP